MLGQFRPRDDLFSRTVLGSAACISPSYAQDLPGGETVIEDAAPIVVTGSRIQNPNLEQSSPVQVVGETEIGLRQATNAEELIGDLPGVSPGASSAVNNGSASFASLNLRGVGTNRSLELFAGPRLRPSSLRHATHPNLLPGPLIDAREIISLRAPADQGT